MKLHHIGIACADLQLAKKQYLELNFYVQQDLVTDLERNLDYIFMQSDSLLIELVAVHDPLFRTDIDTIVSQLKPIGNKMYHICFETDDMIGMIKKYMKMGYKLIKEPSPAIACGNKIVVFLIHNSLGLIEFIEK